MRIVKALIVPTLAAAMVSAPAALAAPNQTSFTAQVEAQDIDLTTEKGIALLDDRAKTIIRRQCANGGRDSVSRRLERECRQSAYAATEGSIRFAVNQAKMRKVRLAAGKPVAPEA